MPERYLKSTLLLGMFALVIGVYWPTLAADFLHWDDDINVFDNPNVQGLTMANLKWMFSDFEQAIRYKAFAWLGWALVHELFGLNPFGYHLANIFLHTINTWLVFFLCLRLIPDDDAKKATTAAAVAALLFALHPLRVEPVAWVTGLPYHIALMFVLGSLIFYLKTDPNRSGFQQRNYWLSVAMYLLAVMTYPTVLGFCAALIALDFFPLKRFEKTWWNRQIWKEKLPFVALAGLLIAGTVYGRFFSAGTWFEAADTAEFTLAERAMQSFYVWAYYVWKPLWPTGLCPVYPTLLQFSPADPIFVVSAIGVLGLSVFLWRKRERWPWALALWVAHLGLLVPMLGLTERPHYPHDRYSIMNGVLWSFLFFGLWLKLRKPQVIAIGLVVVAVGAFLSNRQARIWKNDITFFTYLSKHSGTPRLVASAHMKLGNAYGDNGEDMFALEHYELAWKAAPQYPYFHLPYNHGTALLRLGRSSAAAEMFERALRIDEMHLGTLNNLGICRQQLRQHDEAIALFRSAVNLSPDNPDSLYNLGAALMETDNRQEALPILLRSLRSNPLSPATHRKLIDLYTLEGKPQLAEQHAQAVLQIEAARDAALNQTTGN
ncbi:MAG: tetratricopeptide repeat protein [Limisphaerales bacterium]